jgi:ferredoxin-type protein NapH
MSKRRADLRMKILRAMRRAGHRYNGLRTLSMLVSMAILLGVPLSGLARVDAWRGRQRVLFHEAPFNQALAGVVLIISGLYVVTFLSNVVAGRMFCGWGCPVGQLSRFAEVLDTPGSKPRDRRLAHLKGALFSFALVVAFLVWWVDPRVFWQGSARALAVAWAVLLVGIGLAWAHARWWRWEFCKSACPIGLYYSFVSPARWYGVYFRNQTSSCIECNACDNVCPVDLAPRELMAPVEARGGISVADAPGRNHCLECGDCVRACEWMIERKGQGPVPLLLGYYRGPQRIDALDEATTTSG